jgi:hypothetical protein
VVEKLTVAIVARPVFSTRPTWRLERTRSVMRITKPAKFYANGCTKLPGTRCRAVQV